MTRVAVAIATFYGEKYHLVNLLRSLVPLAPELVSIADTSRADAETIQEFRDWLFDRAKEYGLHIVVTHKPFDGSYSHAKNRALDVAYTCTDWTMLLDSDEILSLQAARDMRDYLGGLSEHILVSRIRKIDLFDDDRTCMQKCLWPPWLRRNMGAHPRIFRSGIGRYVGPIHEYFDYPGRKTIPFHSPEHPKADWGGQMEHCLLHLWVYKDNMMRRRWGKDLDLSKIPLGGTPDEQWRAAKQSWVTHRHYQIVQVPAEVTWIPIIWEVDPSKWVVAQEKGRFVYRLRYAQGGR